MNPPLWLALHFPLLALEAVDGPSPEPRVLVRQQRITLANAAARGAGVSVGLRLGTARALCDDLQVQQANPQREERALLREARHLLAMTPQVCLAPPHTLLLEVGGCLSLFGGFSGLLSRVDQYRLHCPLTSHLGLGPTPLAAWHLTELPTLEHLPERSRFQAWLATLPIDTLALEDAVKERLRAPGFHTLGDLFALPRAALGKRFGTSFLDWLQRLLGEKADVRRAIPAPAPFREQQQFDDPINDQALLKIPMAALLEQMEQNLRRYQEQVLAIRWHLRLDNRERHTLLVRRARPAHDAAGWLDLSLRRLEHQPLDGAVLGLGLDTSRPRPLNPGLAALFPEPGARAPLSGLLEKLVDTPGLALYRPALADDHLPEYSECRQPPFGMKPREPEQDQADQDRPLWLLESPLRLHQDNGVPVWRGQPLRLFPQQERFSQPWRGTMPRHYRLAHHPQGECCWLFQDARQQWWLHGFF
ncbi:Y-family DNA polymerase [Alcanivoracaceae bacterium MT1]